MKMFKILKNTVTMCIAIICLFMPYTVNAEGGNMPSDFEVQYTFPNSGFTHQVRLWRGVRQTGLNYDSSPVTVESQITNSNQYFLSLPKETEYGKLTITFPNDCAVYVDGARLESGAEIAAFSEGEHVLLCNGEKNSLTVIYKSDIPSVYITAPQSEMDLVNTDKDARTTGQITVVSNDKIEYSGPLEYIKGRGNTTWFNVKKPYNIKLVKKANLFDMGEAKKYTLLADYYDKTQLRNKLAYDLALGAGIEYTSNSQHVNLYINNQYQGRYTFVESLEINKNRIDIVDLEEINEGLNAGIGQDEYVLRSSNPNEEAYTPGAYKWVELPNEEASLDGGFLLELEFSVRYGSNASGFVSDYGQAVVLKSPEYATKAQVEYIKGYYQEFEDAVISDDGYNSLGKHYSEYIDVDSFARMYVYQEYTKNLDGGISSFYLYKDVGEKLTAGPVWDMDSSLGKENVINGHDLSSPEGIWAGDAKDYTNNEKYSVLSLCYKHNDFKRAAQEQWQEYFEPYIDEFAEYAVDMSEDLETSVVADMARWKGKEGRTLDEIKEIYKNENERLINFIEKRAEYMSDYFDDDVHFTQYCANGGEGFVIDTNSYKSGESASIKPNNFVNSNYNFLGWNTTSDGSGNWYYPGDSVEISEEDIILFAQWEGYESDYAYRQPPQEEDSLLQNILDFIDKIF